MKNLIFTSTVKKKVLHFAPASILQTIQKPKNLDYTTTDLLSLADVKQTSVICP
jgi:hypothetical protein